LQSFRSNFDRKRFSCGLPFSAVAAGRTLGVFLGSVLASAYRELSVALVCSQGFVYRASGNLLAEASSRPVLGVKMFRSGIGVVGVRCLVVLCAHAPSCGAQCACVHVCYFQCLIAN
jgi:hypothetical protein